MPDFAPYIDYPPGTPVNQWGELNRSRSWSSYWLWRDGKRQDDAIARCPRTADIVSALPLADTPGLAPTVMFSALAARTHQGASGNLGLAMIQQRLDAETVALDERMTRFEATLQALVD